MTTLDARNFAGGPSGHAGTLADPWPGTAIRDAIVALPQPAGGTVTVADGIWLFNSAITITTSNFILQGNSRNAILRFVLATGGQPLHLSHAANFTLTNLTIDPSAMPHNAPTNSGMIVTKCTNCNFTNSEYRGHPNGSIPGTFWEGGADILFSGNDITAGPEGGGSTQFQPFETTTSGNNIRITITQNHFHDCNITAFGWDGITITNNLVTNENNHGTITIVAGGPWSWTARNFLIDGNTVDASPWNAAIISGLPNDPGGSSNVDGFVVTNNIVKGTAAYIAVQSLDNNNYAPGGGLDVDHKSNVVIRNNTINSIFGAPYIDIRGGDGTVDIVHISGNTLIKASGTSLIKGDAHTTNTFITQPGATLQGFTATGPDTGGGGGMTAPGLATTAPTLGKPLVSVIVPSVVNELLGDFVLDNGLMALHNFAASLHLCSGAPVLYADALRLSLGHYTTAAGGLFGVPTNATPNGRQVTSIAGSGSAVGNGTPVCVAIVDDAFQRVLAVGPIINPAPVVPTQLFQVPPFAVIIAASLS